MTDFPLYSKIAFLIAYMIFSIGLIIRLGTKDPGSRAFSLALWAGGLWVVSRALFHGIDNPDIATEINKMSFFLGNIIGVLIFRFAYIFPNNKKVPEYLTTILVFSLALLIPFFLNESIAVGRVFDVGGIQRWGWEQGPWLPLHDLHFIGLIIISVTYLYFKIRNYSPEFQKNFFITLGIVILGFTPPIIVTNILPRFFNVFSYDWISSLSMVGWVSTLSYVVIKYNQMNTKTVATELLVLAAMGLLFLNIFI